MASIIIPAHNEAAVIARCLDALLQEARPGEVEVIVVANGCSDATADIARGYGPSVRVIETEVASKAFALNLGDQLATRFPRLYIDADVVVTIGSVRRLCDALAGGAALAAAPAVDTKFPAGTQLTVRLYYDFWMRLPHIRQGMIAAGAFALSEAGRRRFETFPEIISDDGFVRLHFTNEERVEIAEAKSVVTAPATVADLIRIRTRSLLGVAQLRQRFGDLFRREAASKGYANVLWFVVAHPDRYAGALAYLSVNLIARARVQFQAVAPERYVWERDESSRGPNLAG